MMISLLGCSQPAMRQPKHMCTHSSRTPQSAVYTVTISKHPKCTCPDFGNGNVCKHVLFVLTRVLGLRPTNPLVWQRGLLKSEVWPS